MTAAGRRSANRAALDVRRLNDVERAPGFLARVQDPAAVARAFGELGLAGKLSRDHEDLIEPEEEDLQRFARFERSVLLGRLVAAYFIARFLWMVLDGW